MVLFVGGNLYVTVTGPWAMNQENTRIVPITKKLHSQFQLFSKYVW